MLELRPYQIEAIEAVREAFARERAVVLQMPTGSGKTIVAGAISVRLKKALDAKHKGKHVLYLTHRAELMSQAARTLTEFGLGADIGFIASGRAETPWAAFQLASIQTMARRLGRLPWLKPRLLFIDECHHVRAATWERVVSHYQGARVLGMTATPARLDGKGLGAVFGEIVHGPSVHDLIGAGALCDLDMFSIAGGFDLRGVHRRMGDYSKSELAERATGPVIASTVQNWLRLARDRLTINYSVSRKHSRQVVEGVRSHGITAEHVDGETPAAERDAIFRRFASGDLRFVSNVDIVTEGFDAPECSCVILKPTQSLTLFLQMVGRVMRPKADGSRGMVLDVGGNLAADRHGDPRESYRWDLAGGVETGEGSRERRASLRRCANCGFMYPVRAPRCPLCHHEPKTRTAIEVEHDLVKVGDGELAKRKEKRKAKVAMRELNAQIMATRGDQDKLKAIQRKYGYHPNVVHVWKSRFRLYFAAAKKRDAEKENQDSGRRP